MMKREGKNWGLKAVVCAAIVVWQIYEMATTSVVAPGQGGYLGLLILGVALVGLVASLLKLTVDY